MSDKDKSKDKRKSLTLSSGSSKSKDKDKDKNRDKDKSKKDKRKTVHLTSSSGMEYTNENADKATAKPVETSIKVVVPDKHTEVKVEIQVPESDATREPSDKSDQKQLRKQMSKKMSVRLLSIASKFVQDEGEEKKDEKVPPPVLKLGDLEGVKTTDIFTNALGSFKHLELISPRVPLPGETTPRSDSSAKLPTPRQVEVREPVLGTATRLRSASRAKGPKRRLPSKFEADGQAMDPAQLAIHETVAEQSDQSATSFLDQRANHAAEQKKHDATMDLERRQLEEEERMREEKINSQKEQNRFLNSQLYKTAIKKAPERRHDIKFIHCKGKRRVWIRAVDVSYTSMNQGDAFVLDCDRVIYVWNGSKANQMEKAKAAGIAEIIKSHERGGNAEVVKLDKNSTDAEMEQFWQALGGKGPIKPEAEGGDDTEAEKVEADRVKLYNMERQEEDKSLINMVEIEQKDNKLLMEMLDQNKCFVLDCGNELYAWQGRDSPEEDRAQVLVQADKIFRDKDRKPWSRVERVPQGGEPYLFRERFADWPDLSHPNAVKKMFRGIPKFNDDKPKHRAFTVSDMFVEVVRSDFDELDRADGNEEYTVWLIKDQQKVEVPPHLHGHFSSGNCYIVIYVYLRKNTLRHMIWAWEGKHCSKVDAGSAALLSKEEYKKMSRHPFLKQQTVFENKEPVQFLWAFNGKYFVHQGHYEDSISAVNPRMFHLRGTTQLPMHAIELESAQASKLNSRDSFVVFSDKGNWAWHGRGTVSSAEHLAQSDQLANGLHSWSGGKDLRRCNESEESNEFWELIGGKHDYANAPYLSQWDNKVRLFHVTQATATATFAAKEILDFYQDDLVSRDAMIVDAGAELYVWIGAKSNETKKKKAIEISVEYLNMAKQIQNREQIQTYIVQEGFEPVSFKAHFHGWLDKPAIHTQAAGIVKAPNTAPPKVNVMEPEEDRSAALTHSGNVIMDVTEALKEFHKTYTYDELMQPVPPPGVDKSCRENYLSEEDFLKVFGCSRAEYTAMPQWKRVQKKRSTGLF